MYLCIFAPYAGEKANILPVMNHIIFFQISQTVLTHIDVRITQCVHHHTNILKSASGMVLTQNLLTYTQERFMEDH